MKPDSKLNRRSFVARVTGGIAVGAFAVMGRPLRAYQGPTGITDTDSGASADAANYGRGGPGATPFRPHTGYTDNDPTDPENTGRAPGSTGFTDQDSGSRADNAGEGRGGPGSGPYQNPQGPAQPTGITDQDTGSYSDNAGYGRGGPGSGPTEQYPGGSPSYTGITDADSGTSSDNAGYGRGGAGSGPTARPSCSDNDSAATGDPGGQGRRC
ncbi:MAG: hypothetical protein H7X93_11140 [Sphingomonadaceae bacterium]|nr:hypothetical protein [Sphingomonadaceae bacterium]